MKDVQEIGEFVWKGLIRIWPYLLISVPFAVILRLSGLGERLRGAFAARPVVAVFLATAVGAFSPFCSCSVVPVIASMLIAGVPLAPVMSFWLASPTMDPEIFFLSAAALGWDLALARLVATLLVSLGGGLLTLWLSRRGWLGEEVLRREPQRGRVSRLSLRTARGWLKARFLAKRRGETRVGSGCGRSQPEPTAQPACDCAVAQPRPFSARLAREALSSAARVTEFMVLAFLLEAVIRFYVPQSWIAGSIGARNPFAPALAALIGIPMYTSNLLAMPLVGGLLDQGMDPGAALAFLVAGPITTLPAMAAVWGLVRRRVFLLYLGIGLVGALLLGYAYSLVSRLV